MLVNTSQGLFCPAGNFYIDPSRAVDNAIVTHAHSDHARRGSRNYFCVRQGVGVLKLRLGAQIQVIAKDYRESFSLGGIRISFHPAGHILGSAQVRLDDGHQVWVVSGDYKRDVDPTCAAFESVPCDVFVTEATFGTPAYRWPKGVDVGKQIHDWREANAERGVNSLLFAYSLGKAQRVLASLLPHSRRPVFCHPSVYETSQRYLDEGVALPPLRSLAEVRTPLCGELILTPPAYLKTAAGREQLQAPRETAFASGWMATSDRGYDRGFVLSDHADWDDLLLSIRESGAHTVYVMHRGTGALVQQLRRQGLKAYPLSKLNEVPTAQMALL